MELKVVSHLYNLLTIDANARAFADTEGTAEILCELTNRTEGVVTGALVTAVGYEHEGRFVAIAEVGPWFLYLGQIRPVRLVLNACGECLCAIRLFPLTSSPC
jgi:hypothetical protein